MCVKAPSDVGHERVIVRKDNNPCSWWVQVRDSVVRCNRKHLFVLDHPNEEPRSSSASLRFGESTSYNLINHVRRAFQFKSPVHSSTELDYTTCSASPPTFVTAMTFHFLTLRGNQTTLRQRSPG